MILDCQLSATGYGALVTTLKCSGIDAGLRIQYHHIVVLLHIDLTIGLMTGHNSKHLVLIISNRKSMPMNIQEVPLLSILICQSP